MRSFFCLATAVFTLAPANDAAAQGRTTTPVGAGTSLVGSWDGIARGQLDAGWTMVFSPDSVFAFVLGPMADGTWRLDGDQLTIIDTTRGKAASHTFILSVQGDTAYMAAEGRLRTLIRMSRAASDPPLLGSWWYLDQDEAAVPAYVDFTPNGATRLRIPFGVIKGVYSVHGDKIRLRMLTPKPGSSEAKFALRGDTLTVWMDEKRILVRARPLIPLDVKQPERPRLP